ncbi:MAG TPA: P1 family peptidase [Thermoleophilaceae bacterium]|nr:P1 family peptidase [Thermoleophilaceae bacterium]
MITEVPGVRVGHWTDPDARTGCTAIVLPDGARASGEVRGGAPATREWELLAPGRRVERVDVVMLAGGSAFGLAACDGAMRWCEEQGRGHPSLAGRIPIVVGAALFDLLRGDARIRPDAEAGYAACVAAVSGPVALGQVGAGTGATVDKWHGLEHARSAGIGSASERSGELIVGALLAVNAFGGVLEPGAERPPVTGLIVAGGPLEHTTVGVVATNAALDKAACRLVAESAHAGLARALEPVASTLDGDAIVAASTRAIDAPLERVRMLAARATEAAVRVAAGR